ncbi:uncharacterized protein LOC123554499 [Mercenaria mercenaria]|uniref:uncharacterized protein LOC123554499 n=1 Tax=Mercenaria mercenaria TaxID=6596 RepID=UPI00234E5625|nr:uncharacterized protein LOC123554499 [Mercenaria mercenaria]
MNKEYQKSEKDKSGDTSAMDEHGKATNKHDITDKIFNQPESENSHQNKIYPGIETACANFLNDRKKDCFKVSNGEVVDLFHSIYEEFSKAKNEQIRKKVGSIPDKKQKLHEIICSKLRFPQGSVLRGSFNICSFRIDIVEDSDRDMLQEKCVSNNLTLEYVLAADQKLKEMSHLGRTEKLCRVLCKKVGVDEEMVNKFSLELKVKKQDRILRRLKESSGKKKMETMMKSIFYLPLKKKDLLKELQNTPENFDLDFLQNRITELTNGLLVDIFQAVKGDRKQLRSVLCSQFAKLWSVKAKTLNERVIKTVNEAERLKESGQDKELEIFLNLPFFETIYSVSSSPFHTQMKETEHDTRPPVSCTGTENENYSQGSVSQACPAGTQIKPEITDTDNENDSPLYNLDDCIEGEDNPSLILDVHQDYELEDTTTSKKRRKAYDNAFKLRVVQFAENKSNRAAERKFGVKEKSVRYWRKAKDIIQQRPQNMKKNRISKIKDLEMIEKDLCKWFLYYQGKGSIIGKKEIMSKAKMLSKDPKYKIDTKRYFFGTTWCTNFLKTYNLILSRSKKKSVGKETASVNTKFNDGNSDESSRSGEEIDEDISDTDESDSESEKIGTDDFVCNDDDSGDASFDEICNGVGEQDAVEKDTSNGKSEIVVDDETTTNSNECEVELDEFRDSQEVDIENKLHFDSEGVPATDSESVPATVGNLSEDSIVLESRHTETDHDKKCSETEDAFISKGQKRKRSYFGSAFKLEVIQFVEKSGKRAAEEKFGITESLLNEWCNAKASIEEKAKNKRKTRHPPKFEEDLVLWIQGMQESGSVITAKLVATKARALRDEGKYDMDPFDYKFSDSWAHKFLRRYGLIVDRKKKSVNDKVDKNDSRNNSNTDIPPELLGIPNQSGSETSDGKLRRQSYDNAFKSSVISFAESSSNVLAVRVFKISEKLVRDWRKSKDSIVNGPKDKKRHVTGHVPFEQLEKDLVSWCESLKRDGKKLSRSIVMLKARQLAKEGKYNVDTSEFKASYGWCTNFFRRNGYVCEVGDRRFRAGRQQEKLISGHETEVTDQED